MAGTLMEYIDYDRLTEKQRREADVMYAHLEGAPIIRWRREPWAGTLADYSFPVCKEGTLAKRLGHRYSRAMTRKILGPNPDPDKYPFEEVVSVTPEKGGYMHMKTEVFGLNKEPA